MRKQLHEIDTNACVQLIVYDTCYFIDSMSNTCYFIDIMSNTCYFIDSMSNKDLKKLFRIVSKAEERWPAHGKFTFVGSCSGNCAGIQQCNKTATQRSNTPHCKASGSACPWWL